MAYPYGFRLMRSLDPWLYIPCVQNANIPQQASYMFLCCFMKGGE